ncbi:SRR1-like protein isoform X1 [Falco biarmicus]|uniref:SRR1-like protein isoform X1 n=1 Tax=Falco cherrug TaxID=345164 RepID=UPI0024795B38|nr:SRR1-like protein isoform X1 [Falco cherrug]XP_056202048.1 SRR1-like protein isoform X1 [Falco biarmicus]
MAAAPGGWRAAGGRRRRAGGEAAGAGAVLRRLREARDDLLSSGFWEASAGAVRAPLGSSAEPPAHCVCYGLGRFSVCPAARHQLAFLLLLLEELGEGKHDVEGSATLFYMVHCGKALYNNLLWRNWSAGALAKMVIIGNSFKGIEERLLSRILERDYSYIAKVLKGTEEVALPTHPRYLDTFNDTSIHWFPLQKLKELSPEVWEFMEEPMYQDCDDLEIIRKEDRTDRHSPAATES